MVILHNQILEIHSTKLRLSLESRETNEKRMESYYFPIFLFVSSFERGRKQVIFFFYVLSFSCSLWFLFFFFKIGRTDLFVYLNYFIVFFSPFFFLKENKEMLFYLSFLLHVPTKKNMLIFSKNFSFELLFSIFLSSFFSLFI